MKGTIKHSLGGYYITITDKKMLLKSDWCHTLWGAKRSLKRMVKDVTSEPVYEEEIKNGNKK